MHHFAPRTNPALMDRSLDHHQKCGRTSKPATRERLKISHFEEIEICHVSFPATHMREAVHGESTRNGDDLVRFVTLRRRGWSCRRIARELGVNRETVSRYLRLAAGVQNRTNPPTGSTELAEIGPDSNPAIALTGSDPPKPANALAGSGPSDLAIALAGCSGAEVFGITFPM